MASVPITEQMLDDAKYLEEVFEHLGLNLVKTTNTDNVSPALAFVAYLEAEKPKKRKRKQQL